MITLEQRNNELTLAKAAVLADNAPAIRALFAFLRAAQKHPLSDAPTKYELAALLDHACEEPL